MSLKFNTQTFYSNLAEFFEAVVKTADFWDRTSESSATVGGVTLSCEGSSLTISGYGRSASLTGNTVSFSRIAASENGLLACWGSSSSTSTNIVILGRATDGSWGGITSNLGGTSGISFIVPGVGSVSGQAITASSADRLTQFIPAVSLHGETVFENIFRLIMSPNTAYVGKVRLDNGEEFYQIYSWALKYTE